MDIRAIRVQKGHPDTATGRLIKSLCLEIERLQRKELKWQFLFKQVVQLHKRQTRLRRAA